MAHIMAVKQLPNFNKVNLKFAPEPMVPKALMFTLPTTELQTENTVLL